MFGELPCPEGWRGPSGRGSSARYPFGRKIAVVAAQAPEVDGDASTRRTSALGVVTARSRRSSAFEQSGELGSRLRVAREARNLSLRSLARLIDVSPAFISQIERGRATPSVGRLLALARELGVSLDALLDLQPLARRSADTVQPPAKPRPDDRSRGIASARGLALEVRAVNYAAGSRARPLWIPGSYAGRGYGHVISGSIGVLLSGQAYELGPGDSITFGSVVPSGVWGSSPEPAWTVWVLARRGGV